MFDECTPCVAPAAYGVKVRGSMANAQVINAVPVEATQRDYTIERIKDLGEKYAQALRVQFHMDQQHPQTFLQLVDAIKNGNYTVNEEEVNSEVAAFAGWSYGVRWGIKPDRDGYKAAKEVLKAAAQKALTKATLKPIDQLEAVIEDFEGWKL